MKVSQAVLPLTLCLLLFVVVMTWAQQDTSSNEEDAEHIALLEQIMEENRKIMEEARNYRRETCPGGRSVTTQSPEIMYMNEFIVQLTEGSNPDVVAAELGLENKGVYPGYFTEDDETVTYKFHGGLEEKRELVHPAIEKYVQTRYEEVMDFVDRCH